MPLDKSILVLSLLNGLKPRVRTSDGFYGAGFTIGLKSKSALKYEK